MRSIAKSLILLLAIFITIFSFYSCVDEPLIEPLKRPYSVVRFVNLSSNLNSLQIKIFEGSEIVKTISNLQQGSSTDYSDFLSGKHKFIIVSGTDTVYNKDIEFASYERMTVIFAGWYSNIKELNTFAHFNFDENEVYVSAAPASGTCNLYLINASTGTQALDALKFEFLGQRKLAGETTFKNFVHLGKFEFGNVYSYPNHTLGNYLFHFREQGKSVSKISYPADSLFNSKAGKRYYIYLYGAPDNLKVLMDEKDPLPIRSK